MLHWEEIQSDGRMTVSRAEVPNGWLVFTRWGSNLAGVTFYPDPNHQWDATPVETPKKKAKKR